MPLILLKQGGFAELQGGDFGSSFLSGFTGSIAGSMITAKSGDESFFGAKNKGGKYLARRTVAAAVVGGTTSEIAGGKFANGAATAAMVHLLNHEEGLQELLANDDQGDVFYYDVKARDLSVDLEKQFDKTIAVGEGIGILGKIKSGRGLLSGLFKRNATEVVTNTSDLAGVPLTPVDAGISLASETTKMFGGVGKGMVHTTRRTRGGSWQTSYRAVHMRGSTIIRDTGWVTIDSIQPLRSMAISQGNRAANTTMNKWESALND